MKSITANNGDTQRDLVLWGRRGEDAWVKLTDNTSRAEMRRREKDGWTVLRYPKGESPGQIEDVLAGSADN